MWIGMTEYGVRQYPRGLEGCRLFRIEYGGFNEMELAETTIWLPPEVDVREFELYLRKLWDDFPDYRFQEEENSEEE
jgi:hypothetical protein